MISAKIEIATSVGILALISRPAGVLTLANCACGTAFLFKAINTALAFLLLATNPKYFGSVCKALAKLSSSPSPCVHTTTYSLRCKVGSKAFSITLSLAAENISSSTRSEITVTLNPERAPNSHKALAMCDRPKIFNSSNGIIGST